MARRYVKGTFYIFRGRWPYPLECSNVVEDGGALFDEKGTIAYPMGDPRMQHVPLAIALVWRATRRK
jgi:hypothetical protein